MFYAVIDTNVLVSALLNINSNLRASLGTVFRELALQKESYVEEGHLMPDHVHMLISIPPKYSVANVIGYIKGKSSIWVARNWYGMQRNYTGQAFWARGYYVSTVGRDENVIREYIVNQEKREQHDDRQLLPICKRQCRYLTTFEIRSVPRDGS